MLRSPNSNAEFNAGSNKLLVHSPLATRAPLVALALAALSLWTTPHCVGQIAAAGTSSAAAPRLGDALVTRYRVGVIVTAGTGGAQRIRAMVAVPLECDEQQVQVVNEEYSPEVQDVDFRMLAGEGARQMLVQMPRIESRQKGSALITYDVTTHAILPPLDTSMLASPKRPDRELKRFLGPSPFINVNHRRIRAALAEAMEAHDQSEAPSESESSEAATPGASTDQQQESSEAAADSTATDQLDVETTGSIIGGSDAAVVRARDDAADADDPDLTAAPSEDWQRVEAIYEYVLDKVSYKEGVDKSAVQVLSEGEGDCQAIGALFVAMCRTAKVPARLVWVHDHQYAEFYLEEAAGQGHWYPVETAGQRAFGAMPLPRVILQKGDDFRVPERPRERLRYASDYLLGFPVPGGGKPRVKYVREPL